MRQNPHVRICGGPGSATTLVYPTAGHRQDLPRLEDYRTVWTLDDWSLIERSNPNYVVVDGGRHCGRDNGRLHTIFLSRQNYRLVFQGSRSEFLLGRLATDVYHSHAIVASRI